MMKFGSWEICAPPAQGPVRAMAYPILTGASCANAGASTAASSEPAISFVTILESMVFPPLGIRSFRIIFKALYAAACGTVKPIVGDPNSLCGSGNSSQDTRR